MDLAGEVSLQAATDLSQRVPFGGSSLDVGAGGRVHAHAGDDGHVECSVESAVTAAVEAVTDHVPRGHGDRVHAGEAGEGGFGADPARV